MDLPKYPRTYHIEGSKGVSDPDAIPFSYLRGKNLVVEEKMDGSMVSIHFDESATLKIQHRNHEVQGPEFALLKRWLSEIQNELFDRLEDRFVLYGEWLFACHTIFYNYLPSYFLEYDVYDKQEKIYLSTAKRKSLIFGLPFESVLVLDEGPCFSLRMLDELVMSSSFIFPNQRETAVELFESIGLRRGDALNNLDLSGVMEGLYIKYEDENQVLGRFKYIRKEFIETILRSEHWSKRPLIQNKLRCSST